MFDPRAHVTLIETSQVTDGHDRDDNDQDTPCDNADLIRARSTKMYFIHEDLARAHMRARIDEARQINRSRSLLRAKRLRRRADRANAQARLLLARSI